MLSSRARRRVFAAVGAFVIALGAMHLTLDGLTGVLVPLQPTLSVSTGADPAALGLLVALALASASLLQPLTAVVAARWGDGRAATAGGLLAAAGYGALPAASSTAHAAAAVALGGLGSALFHPAAGALVARAAPPGGEALPLAMFSAVGTGGAALVPLAVLTGVDSMGGAAALPFAAILTALAAGLLFGRAVRAASPRPTSVAARSESRGVPSRVIATVAVAALIALTGVTANATAPLLLAEALGPTDPMLGYAVAAYSAAGALGGIALALWVRWLRLTTVMRLAVGAGTLAVLALPHVPALAVPVVMLAVGTGLSGTLPLLVSLARRPGETSAARAVARILGLGTGLGGLGYAGIGALQGAIGYTAALTFTATAAGGAGLLLIGRLDCDDADPDEPLHTALTTCGCGSCVCARAPSDAPPTPAGRLRRPPKMPDTRTLRR